MPVSLTKENAEQRSFVANPKCLHMDEATDTENELLKTRADRKSKHYACTDEGISELFKQTLTEVIAPDTADT